MSAHPTEKKDPPRSADLLVEMLLATPGILGSDMAANEKALRHLALRATKYLPTPALAFDPWIYRLVVIFLGSVVLLATIGAIYLSYLSTTAPGNAAAAIPDVLTALGAAAIGALAGLLAPSPANRTT